MIAKELRVNTDAPNVAGGWIDLDTFTTLRQSGVDIGNTRGDIWHLTDEQFCVLLRIGNQWFPAGQP